LLEGAHFLSRTSSGGVTGNSGLVDAGSSPQNVPEPTSLAIFGTALVSLGLYGRRRKHWLTAEQSVRAYGAL
jgi:hypothetical protein